MEAYGNTVDERVVEMRIDNDKFEAGAKKTISILESLDNSLNALGKQNAAGFEDVGRTMEAVTSKFSVLGTVGDQVLRNLTNSAMGLVSELKHTVEALTTAQVSAGWDKYADKTSAVQTIMAATHKDIGSIYKDEAEQMAAVNKELEKLTWFSDETSYSMLDMVNNIGKFTAAGRGLEESVKAMMGISNWAAISGGKPAEASRAMYNLSQALGVGAVTTIDWKSIEMANMATYEFKQMAIETAEQMGILRKVSDGVWETVEGNYEVTVEKFRDTLSFGKGTEKIQWFNSDVLLSVLSTYGSFAEKLQETIDDLKATTGETYIAKDILEAITDFQNGISIDPELVPYIQELASAEYDLGRRAFIAAQEAKTFQEVIDATKDAVSTKWMNLFEKIFGNYMQAKDLFSNMAEVFYDIFAAPIEKLNDIADIAFGGDNIFTTFDEITGRITSATLLDEVGNIVDLVYDGKQAFTEFTESIEDFADAINPFDQILDMDWQSIVDAGEATDDFKQVVLETAEAYGVLKRAGQDTWHTLSGETVSLGTFTEDLYTNIRDSFTKIFQDNTAQKQAAAESADIWDQFIAKAEEAGADLTEFYRYYDEFEQQLGRSTMAELTQRFGSMGEAIRQGAVELDQVQRYLSYTIEGENIDSKKLLEALDILNKVADGATTIRNKITRLAGALGFNQFWDSTWKEAYGRDFDEAVRNGTFTLDELKTAVENLQILDWDKFQRDLEASGRSMEDFSDAYYALAKGAYDEEKTRKAEKAYGSLINLFKYGAGIEDWYLVSKVFKELGYNIDEYSNKLEDADVETWFNNAKNGKSLKSLDERLQKAGHSVSDLQEALRKVNSEKLDSILEQYGSLDKALKDGAIDAEYFRKALEEMTKDTTHAASGVEGTVQSMEKLREVAMEVLRGDWGNGAERIQRLIEAGYDYNTIQWIAGNLNWMIGQGWDVSQISDEYLFGLPKPENVAAALEGTVQEVKYTQAEIDEMNALLENCDVLLQQIEDGSLDVYDAYEILNGATEGEIQQLQSGGNILRDAMKNFMTFFDDLAGGISEAFDKVLGDKNQRAGRWISLAVSIYNFSKAIQFTGEEAADGTTKMDRFVNAVTGVFRFFKGIGKVISGAWQIVRPIIGAAISIIGSLLTAVGNLMNGVGEWLEGFGEGIGGNLSSFFEELGSHIGFLTGIFEILGTVVLGVVGALMEIGSAVVQFISESEVLSAIVSAIGAAFSKIEGVVTRVAGYIREAYESAEEGQRAKAAVTALLQSMERGITRLVPGGEKLMAFFHGVWDFLKNGLSGVGDVILAPFGAITAGFTAMWSAIKGEDVDTGEVEKKVSPIREAFTNLLGAIFAKPEEIKSRVTQFLGSIWEGLKEFASTIRFRDVVSMLRLAVVTTIAGDLLEFINTFKYIRLGVNDLIESIGYTFENLSLMIRNLSVNFRAGAMIKMAIAIGIISFCIYKLSKLAMDNPDAEDKITYVASIIAILMLMMSRIAKSLASSNALTHVDIKQFTLIPQMMGTLIGLAALVAATAFAMQKIGKIGDWKAILAAFAPIGVILFMIGALLYTVTRAIIKINDTSIQANKVMATGKAIRNVGRALGSIAAAMLMLMIPIGVFAYIAAKYESGSDALWNAIGKVGAIFGGIILGLSLLTLALVPFRNNAEAIRGIGGTLLRMSVAMMIMAMAISALLIPIGILSFVISRIENRETLQQGFVAVGIMLAALFAFLAGVILVARKSTAEQITAVGKLFARMGGAILALGASILLLMVPILALAAMGKDHMAEIEKASDIVFKMLALMGLLAVAVTAFAVNASSTDNIKAFGNALIKMGLAMVLFSAGALLFDAALLGMLFVIERFSEKLKGLENLRETLITLGIIAGAMLAFGLAAKFLGSGLVLIALAFGIFAASLWVLAHALDAIADAAPRFITAMNKVQRKYSASTLKGVAKTALIITAVVAALALLLGIIIKLKSKGGFIGTIFNWISKLGTSTKNLGTNLLTGLTTAASKLPSALVTFFSKFGKALMDNKESLITSLSAMIAVIGLYVVGIIPTMTESIITAIIQLINSVADSLEEHRAEIKAALTNLVGAIIDILGDVISSIFEGLGWDPVVEWLNGKGKKISTKVKNGVSGSEGANELPEGFGNVPDRGRTALMVGAIAVAYNWLKGKKSIPVSGGTTTGSGSTGPLGSLFDRGKQVGGNQSGSVISKFADHEVLKNTIKSAINESKVSKEGALNGGKDSTISDIGWGAFLKKEALIVGLDVAAKMALLSGYKEHIKNKELDVAYDGGSIDDLEDTLNAFNHAMQEHVSYEEERNQHPILQSYDIVPQALRHGYSEAMEEALRNLVRLLPDVTEQGLLDQYKDAIDPILGYVGLANRHKDAASSLSDAYSDLANKLETLGVSEELFNEYLIKNGSAEKAISMLAIDKYLTMEDIDLMADYLTKARNLEDAVQKLNDTYKIIAERLHISDEEFNRQFEEANGIITNMPAYQSYIEGFTDYVSFSADGLGQLTEKGEEYIRVMKQQAEITKQNSELEAAKQAEYQRMLEGDSYLSHLSEMQREQQELAAQAHSELVKEAEEFRAYLEQNADELKINFETDVKPLGEAELLKLKRDMESALESSGQFDGLKIDMNTIFGGIDSGDIAKEFLSLFDFDKLGEGKSLSERFKGLAGDALGGLKEGLDDVDGIKTSILSLVGTGNDYTSGLLGGWMADGMDSHSPSKKMEQFGIWADEGFANGIESDEGTGYIQSAIINVYGGLLTKLKGYGGDIPKVMSAAIQVAAKSTRIGKIVTANLEGDKVKKEAKLLGNGTGSKLIEGIIAKYKEARNAGEGIGQAILDAFKKKTEGSQVETEVDVLTDINPKIDTEKFITDLAEKMKELPKLIGTIAFGDMANLIFNVGSIDISDDAEEAGAEAAEQYWNGFQKEQKEQIEAAQDSTSTLWEDYLNSDYYKPGTFHAVSWQKPWEEADLTYDDPSGIYFNEQFMKFAHDYFDQLCENIDQLDEEAWSAQQYLEGKARRRKVTGKADMSGLEDKGEGIGAEHGVGPSVTAWNKDIIELKDNYMILGQQAQETINQALEADETISKIADKTRDWLARYADQLNLNIETDIDPISTAKLLTFREDMKARATEYGILDFMLLSPEELVAKMGLDDPSQLIEIITGNFSDFGVKINEAVGLSIEEKAGILNDFTQSVFGDDLPEWFKQALQIGSGRSGVFETESKAIPEGVSSGIKSKSTLTAGAVSDMAEDMTQPMTKIGGEFNQHGKEIPTETGKGVSKESRKAVNAVTSMASSLISPLKGARNQFYSQGVSIAQALASGIRSGVSEVYAAAAELEAASRNSGRNISSGVSAGISSTSGNNKVSNAVTGFANKIITGFNKALGIRSPSRVFMRLAGYIPAGVAEGIDDSSDTAIESVVVLSQDLIDAVEKYMAKVGVLASDSFGEEMSVRPVVDYSGMGPDFQRIQSMLTSQAAMENLRNIGNLNSFNYSGDYENQRRNKEVIDELHNMSMKIGKLGEEMTRMQVVLNTGVLCGELATGMNSKLGGMATRQRR